MNDFFIDIIKSASKYKNDAAIVVRNQAYTYDEVFSYAYYLSCYFFECKSADAICVILSEKTIDLYAGMLACFFSNTIYMPLNIHSGVEKSKLILLTISTKLIFIGDMQYEKLYELISFITDATILFTNKLLYDQCKMSLSNNTLIYINSPLDNFVMYTNTFSEFYKNNKIQSIAYLFFTSGSTGAPKAVPISYHNLSAYISAVSSLFVYSHDDRFIQLSDIAFDISIHEILISFISGGTLYVYDDQSELSVARFIENNKITQCILVPSSMNAIVEQSRFYDASLDSLKCTLVCGESFPLAFARRWESIAPQSMIVNLYGPTEATVCCTYHVYQKNHAYGSLMIMPIGKPFPNIYLEISDKNELIITGDQVSSGYLNGDSQISLKFQFNPAYQLMAYFTGDHVSYDEQYGYLFHGRLDDQWQIKGYRVEKNEVESVLRSVLDSSNIYVAPSMDQHKMVKQLIAFSTNAVDLSKYKSQLQAFLPDSAIPSKIIQLNKIPTLPNGKINYKKLTERALEC